MGKKYLNLYFFAFFYQGRLTNPLWLACSYAALTEMHLAYHFKMHIYKYACDRKIFRVLTKEVYNSEYLQNS